MKKQLFNILLCSLLMVPFLSIKADVDGQSTEGKDFWVTFLQGDADDSGSTDGGALKRFKLSLSISAREAATVKIANDYYGFDTTVIVAANSHREVAIFDGIKTNTRIRGTQTSDYSKTAKAAGTAQYCYSFHPEMVDSCALHVTSDKPISLYASNYKAATFDATNVLPTTSLQSEYKIVCYTPSDHGGDGSSQGTHFAIIASEDNTVVEYVLTANVYNNKHHKGDTVKTDTLKAGQVWYVWSGKGAVMGFGHGADLSGTTVKAYDATTKLPKPIAVFQGNPHTNIPFYKDLPGSLTKAIGERDHIFSQAMPLATWGNTFVLTTSQSRDRDVIRVMAQDDGTEVYLNGDKTNPIHTFDFSQDTQHYWEFEIGVAGVENGRTAATGDFFEGECFLLETSCPCAVHEFMVSKKYGKTNKSNGDPAMLWINPIEQRIDQITFATYSSENGTTNHYTNVVTTADNAANMTLDSVSIASQFKDITINGKVEYKYARLSLGTTAGSHTLRGDSAKGFIAHVYGCTGNESYGYNAGGATKPLTQYITINGQIFTPDSKNTLCGDDVIRFACHPNYVYLKVEWNFGDGSTQTVTYAEAQIDSIVPHTYAKAGVYEAYVLIYRESSNLCSGQNAKDSIPITVTIGNYKVDVKSVEMPTCTQEGEEVDLIIHLDNPSEVSLTGDSVTLNFNDAAKADGLTNDKLTVKNDSTLVIHLPGTAKDQKEYGLHIRIGSDCPNSVLDKDLTFSMHYDKQFLVQRYNNVLGLMRDSFPTQTVENIVWYHDGQPIAGETSSVLTLAENESNNGEYYVCFTVHEEGKADYNYCTCPVTFKASTAVLEFSTDPELLELVATYAIESDKVFVNADWKGKTDIECYAQWITTAGKVYQDLKFNIPDGGCTIPVPSENGLYLLRVVTDDLVRSFKFIIKH